MDTKIIYVCLDKKKKPEHDEDDNEQKQRQMTLHWEFTEAELEWSSILSTLSSLEDGSTKLHQAIKQQINYKVQGYKHQDLKKGLYDHGLIIDTAYVACLLIEKSMTCFYCQKKVQMMYTNVRDPMQWTLDRIDNSVGHNRGNVEIACLQCNLRRRTMHHERYVFTKQLTINKIG